MQFSRPSKPMMSSPAARVLVASSAMLAFISFWRVAAIVLNDMGSSAFYAGAISEHFVGKPAPWFVLAIMLLAGAVAALYIESCGMFVRGGVYRVVKEAMRWYARKIFGFGFDVRLHLDRPDQWRFGRTLSRRFVE
jgi:hypothetical protein